MMYYYFYFNLNLNLKEENKVNHLYYSNYHIRQTLIDKLSL